MPQSLGLLVIFLAIIQLNFILCTQYGEPCSIYKDTCVGSSQHLSCINKTCKCDRSAFLKYTKGASSYCFHSVNDVHQRIDAMVWGKCHDNCTEHQSCNSFGHCECRYPYVTLDKSCYKAVFQKPMEPCYVKDSAYICDHTNFSYCKSSTCVCFSDYYYNSTAGKCILKPKTEDEKLRAVGSLITRYFGKAEDYCAVTSDCAAGLHCLPNFTCSCPGICVYDKIKGICDCGEFETPSAIIITGIILSVVSITFWGCFIRKALQKAKQGDNADSVLDESPLRTTVQENNVSRTLVHPSRPHLEEFRDYNVLQPKSKPIYDEPPSYLEAITTGPPKTYQFNPHTSPLGFHRGSYSAVPTIPLDVGTSQVPLYSPPPFEAASCALPPPYNPQDPLLYSNVLSHNPNIPLVLPEARIYRNNSSDSILTESDPPAYIIEPATTQCPSYPYNRNDVRTN